MIGSTKPLHNSFAISSLIAKNLKHTPLERYFFPAAMKVF